MIAYLMYKSSYVSYTTSWKQTSCCKLLPRVNPNPLSIYTSFGFTYKTHPTASTEMYVFYKWCSLNRRVEGRVEWDVGDLETSLRSVCLWYE